LRAEFSACHEHHIGHIRQGGQSLSRQQVGLNAFNALRAQAALQLRIRKPRHPDHAFVGCCPLGHARQRGAHFARHTQDEDVAL
jgi:hypothetical protein